MFSLILYLINNPSHWVDNCNLISISCFKWQFEGKKWRKINKKTNVSVIRICVKEKIMIYAYELLNLFIF